MGGKGSGGRRLGSGRKLKDAAARALDGGASHRRKGRVLTHPSVPPGLPATPAPPIDLDEADAPNDLTVDERRVWMDLAPLAMGLGTFKPEYSVAFKLLCRNVVLERRYALSVTDAGGSSHRGLIQIIDRELRFFQLSPDAGGKSGSHESEKPAVDPMKEKYFAGGSHLA